MAVREYGMTNHLTSLINRQDLNIEDTNSPKHPNKRYRYLLSLNVRELYHSRRTHSLETSQEFYQMQMLASVSSPFISQTNGGCKTVNSIWRIVKLSLFALKFYSKFLLLSFLLISFGIQHTHGLLN